MENKLLKKSFIVGSILTVTILLRLWNLNLMGRTWDEPVYVEWGYNFMSLIKKGDFSNPYWYKVSGSPPISRYLYGVASAADIERFDSKGKPVFRYDYTYTRLVSVLLSSITVFVVILLGWKYVSFFVGITAGIILSMLPVFLGYSQIATLESPILFFFTITIFFFFNFLTKRSKKSIIFTGIFLGLAFGVKYTNILLVPLMIWIFLMWFFQNTANFKDFLRYTKLLIFIFVIAFLTFFIVWPMPWFHLSEVLSYNSNLRYSPYSVPEVFFGKLLLVPKVYYFVYFLITTPLAILLLFFLGLYAISGHDFSFLYPIAALKKIVKFRDNFFKQGFKKKVKINLLSFILLQKLPSKNKSRYNSWIFFALFLWFILPFSQSVYNFRQHGIRYIIEIYAPLSLIAAIGFEYLLQKFAVSRKTKYVSLFILIIYMGFLLKSLSPYYLDYFNEVVGGPKTVYNKKLFQMGWWGQGVREAAYFIRDNAQDGSKIGVAISPIDVMPVLPNLHVSQYSGSNSYDYILVNYYNVIREGFDDTIIKKNYMIAYTVNADGAILATVYKRKK